jgi:hypothetical protein
VRSLAACAIVYAEHATSGVVHANNLHDDHPGVEFVFELERQGQVGFSHRAGVSPVMSDECEITVADRAGECVERRDRAAAVNEFFSRTCGTGLEAEAGSRALPYGATMEILAVPTLSR